MATRRTRRREVLRTLGAIAFAGLAGCSRGGSAGPREVAMTDDLTFEPGRISVDVGTTVTWRNAGRIEHTVTAYGDSIPSGAAYFASGGFESESAARRQLTAGLIGPDDAYSHTFEAAGVHDYFCIPHESSGMVGTVRVG